MAKIHIGARISREEAEEVRKLAAADRRKVSWQIAELISEALAARRSQQQGEQHAA